MLGNTYDASGIKFGLFITDDISDFDEYVDVDDPENLVDEMVNWFDNDYHNSHIIDFSSFDGLTIKECLDFPYYVSDDTVYFTVYSEMTYPDSDGKPDTDYNILKVIPIKMKDDNENKPIDELVEQYIVNNYKKEDEDSKRYMRCFLQRYRTGTMIATDNFIDEKVLRKQP